MDYLLFDATLPGKTPKNSCDRYYFGETNELKFQDVTKVVAKILCAGDKLPIAEVSNVITYCNSEEEQRLAATGLLHNSHSKAAKARSWYGGIYIAHLKDSLKMPQNRLTMYLAYLVSG